VLGLQPWDFQVFDNGKPTKIMFFRSFDDGHVQPNPAVEVILLVDELNLSFQQVAFIRSQLSEFLSQNQGHLRYPVSIMLLSDAGLQVQPRPSLDGKSLVSVVEGIHAHVSVINSAMGAEGALERFQRSLRALETIAESYARSPRRRFLIWVGPGWPMLERSNFTFTDKNQRQYFDAIVELTNRLREARVVVYSVSPIDPSIGNAQANPRRYEGYLKAVESAKQADTGNLALKVIVTHTGGMIFGPDSDIAGQISSCTSGANAFYVLSFNPPAAARQDEYHALTVKVNRDGVAVRTSAGYYYEP
jgi:VWFA-related protein